MRRALFTEEEVRLATERRLKYLGTAKVNIYQIQFDPPLPRDLDPKNLDRLCEIFRKNRCRRLDVDNHVPAIVSWQDLADALRKAKVPQQSLLTNDPYQCPQLGFAAGQLRALHGRHRVQAGAKVLPPADRWWTVDLYVDDIGEELRTSLIEEYANQKKPTDGQIYRKIRQYEGEDNESFRQRWFVRLSPSNQDRLDQLDNKRNRRLRRAFDRLLPIPGLWPHGMRISMLHRLIATSCVDEILTYLEHIGYFWSSIVDSDPVSMKKIDLDTVDALQLLAPGRSRTDAKLACGLVLSGQAFAEFSEEERRIIWSRMKDFDGLIPSLYTFFEDFKYLESCAHCVKRLFGPSTESVWETMRSMFIPSSNLEGGECVIQTSESTFRHQWATDVKRLEMGYLQVWLYAMRHYPLMPSDPKKVDDLLAKPIRAKADERAIYEMAELARRVGFESPEIDALINGSPDHQIARAALLQARKPSRFRYDAQQFEILVSRIVDCFAVAVPDQPDMTHDLLADSTVKPRARCGMPQTRTHKQDSPLLFLDRLHADDIGFTDTITSFYVRRCVYFSFFGRPAIPGPTSSDRAGESSGDIPWSPLFVGEDGSSGDHGSARPAALPSGSPHQEREEPQGRGARRGEKQHIPRRQQVQRDKRKRGVAKQRRKRRAQMRKRKLHPTGEGDHEPEDYDMELDGPSMESSDEDMYDYSSQELSDEGPQDESMQSDPATAPTHGPAAPEETDTHSHCTRISLEATPLEQDSDDRPTVEGPPLDNGLEDQARIAHPSQPQPTEIEDDNSTSVGGPAGQEQGLKEYVDHIMRAREEQDKLEEELDHERLQEELGISYQKQPVLEPSPRPRERQNSPLAPPDDQSADVTHNNKLVAPVSETTQDPSPASHREGQLGPPADAGTSILVEAPPPQPPALVEISFWEFKGEWKKSDCVRAGASSLRPLELMATKYLRKNYSLYDRNLHSLSPTQCYRAATADGSNVIFMISKDEEQKLASQGRITKDKQLLSLISRVLPEQ
ncbi:hypothetical protein BDQ94DRAFT_180863 [Aspergillus welwitschiae]|uniref:Uncharacterized protein n=1 Tax=Aspergillus welwitschiae TaxID=1341132 RepID=A0A3F3PVR0_9EURO|nr:hypothetical protein BDQ94DRAFT_180863 [Aspergillus welwitschiae]RDH30832.1 hypothetical protein BDQ94DRAFT_180863 [Aspergillus welwitschiae]